MLYLLSRSKIIDRGCLTGRKLKKNMLEFDAQPSRIKQISISARGLLDTAALDFQIKQRSELASLLVDRPVGYLGQRFNSVLKSK